MPFEARNSLGHNWFIRANVERAMKRHESEGCLDTTLHVYLGDTERIEEVVAAFGNSSQEADVASTRIYTRLSCTNGLSGKFHVVSLYQTERLAGGCKKQLLEATWTPKARMPLQNVVGIIQNSFEGLVQGNPKYGRKPPEVVGFLHEFR